ncbi:cell division protein FtsP [Serratia symbiotica]|uniref:cell division protein FtsP n=1 Tax=Serratia symbiotica TaxID=138074 RepID=UPI001CF09305|nr:cell division protein FtsP [Serratia symbiotica]
MAFNRRQFIQASSLALCASAMPLRAKASRMQTPLPIPPLLESHHGQPLFLTLQRVHWAFMGNHKASVWGINGMYLGPTVRVHNGDDIKLIYSNRLPEPVAMTISGLQLPGSLIGGAQRMMSPNVNWSPVLPIRQGAATCWYHASTPNRMAPHIYNGLAGLWLVEDKVSKALPLPQHYGVNDFPLIIQDRRFDRFARPEYNPPSQGGFVGDTLLVNGVQTPYVEVSRGWVRLRLLNASNSRRYIMQLSNGQPLNVIASDQGFLPAPVAVQNLSLAPGERREVLIDMSKGEEVTLNTGEVAGIIDRLRALFEPSNLLVSNQVLTLRPTGLLPLVTDNLPMRLLADHLLDGSASCTRDFRLGGNVAGINGTVWAMNRIDGQTQQGTWERWNIHADTPQAFHIQGVKFLIKRVNGVPPMAEDRGWKDTVWVDGDVELLVYFNQSTSEHFPFIYYSQTLELADRGSAGQLMVQPAQ